VAASALKAQNGVDSSKALEAAKQFENVDNREMAGSVADVYAKEGDAGYQNYFEDRLRSVNGIGKYSLFYYYANFLIRMDKYVVLHGIQTIEEEGMVSDNHFFVGGAKGSLKRIAKSFEEKRKKAQSEVDAQPKQDDKSELQEKVNDYSLIVSNANDAVQRLNKKNELKKE